MTELEILFVHDFIERLCMESSQSDRLNFWQMAKLPGLRWLNDAHFELSFLFVAIMI